MWGKGPTVNYKRGGRNARPARRIQTTRRAASSIESSPPTEVGNIDPARGYNGAETIRRASRARSVPHKIEGSLGGSPCLHCWRLRWSFCEPLTVQNQRTGRRSVLNGLRDATGGPSTICSPLWSICERPFLLLVQKGWGR